MQDQIKYDAIVIGSGAGGSAVAYQLTQLGKRVLLLEKGAVLPKDGSTMDIEKVVNRHLFIDDEPWLDQNKQVIYPQERSNFGGKTKWYGAALLRFSPHEFDEDVSHQCLPWPITYQELAPYYEEAEHLLGVGTFPIEPDLQKIIRLLRLRDTQWSKQSLPMALSPDILNFPDEAKYFDAFASTRGLKGDGEKLLDKVKAKPNLTVMTGKKVVALKMTDLHASRISGVLCEDGTTYLAHHVILAGGALHSPRLLQRYMEETGLADKLLCYQQIGRNYKYHVLTAMLALNMRVQTDVLRKTTFMLHHAFPHSSVQPLGWLDGKLLAPELPKFAPSWLASALGKRAYGFFLQTEDGSHPENRIVHSSNGRGLPQLDYDLDRLPAAQQEHHQFVKTLQRQLLSAGYIGLTKPIPITGTAHACGTLAAGLNPATSVVNAEGRVHGLENLYVADSSILPRSSRVNPALTIYAWALRLASLINKGSHV